MDEPDVIEESETVGLPWERAIRELSVQWKHRFKVQFSLEHGNVFAYIEFQYLGYFPGRLEARKEGAKTDIRVVVSVSSDKMREYLDVQGLLPDGVFRKEFAKLERKVMDWIPMVAENLQLQPMEEIATVGV